MNEFIQSDNIFRKLYHFFSNDVNLYVLENNIMTPIKKLKYIDKYDDTTSRVKYYITVYIGANCEKYLVFDNKNKVKECYHNIKDIVQEKLPKFSTYMEVINQTSKVDVLDIFNCYDDHKQKFFSDVTKYNLKSSDLYDFKNNCFVVCPNDTIEITKMNLDTKIIEPGQEIVYSII